MGEYRLIDDFSGELSTFGTPWDGFTDQVMGGVSEQRVIRINNSEGSFVRMSGNVSLDNNGGFIQIRVKLAEGLSFFDGSSFNGIRLTVRGLGDSYYLFVRTSSTVLPWKFYKATVPLYSDWSTVDIPWTAFQKGDFGRLAAFNSRKLKSIALVAYGEDFQAQVDLGEIGFY